MLEVSQDVVSIYTALEDPVDNLYLPPRVISVSNLRRTLVVFIGNDNLNKIKNTGSVGRFQSQTWLSAYVNYGLCCVYKGIFLCYIVAIFYVQWYNRKP